jgi:3-oxoacyl-[acyl-carrier protein] reductase
VTFEPHPKEIRDISRPIHAMNPGGVETEGLHSIGIIGSDFEKQMVALTPLGRLGQPDDIVPVAWRPRLLASH